MQVIIPVAGYATRLFPLTKDKPKTLLPVKGKPIIEHIIARIEELPDVKSIFVVSNDRFFPNLREWLDNFSSKLPIKLLNDGTRSNEDRLGQIGDIQLAIDEGKIEEDLLVVAGDNLFNFSLLPAYRFFKEKKTVVNALWDAKSLETAKQQGIAIIDKGKKMVDFQEKDPNPKSTSISLGIYFVPGNQVKLFKKFIEEGNNSDKMGYFMIWLIKNSVVYGHVYYKKWFDIGWPSALEKCRKEFVP